MTWSLVFVTTAVALASVLMSPRARSVASFFQGRDEGGQAPGVMALTLSQVTTWIFARSIMNAAILGYFYGIAGALAYAAYYLSFLTGAWIISSLRFRHGFGSVQDFLAARFGRTGTATYNFVVGVRLLSEVFANLLVIGLIFGAAGTQAYVISILLVGGVTFGYAALGGLSASIRTDVMQMGLLLGLLAVLVALAAPDFDFGGMLMTSPDIASPGWVLLAVALLQVWSYPLHDPVMMDRGFIADRRTTLASFYHACWLSFACILAFGLLGVWAGMEKAQGETLIPTLTRLLGETPMLAFNAALIISCMSTLDSTFASAAKLSVVDMKLGRASVANGRLAMALFLLGGLAMVFLGSKDLFEAVAVSGTASMFLAPVVFFSLWLGRDDIPLWSYMTAFAAAIGAAALYFLESSGYTGVVGAVTGLDHKYAKLLALSAAALAAGCAAFLAGMAGSARSTARPVAGGA
ncbi:MAG: hypothetical protein AB7U38_07560 [Hyphomicrobiales bacterium]